MPCKSKNRTRSSFAIIMENGCMVEPYVGMAQVKKMAAPLNVYNVHNSAVKVV